MSLATILEAITRRRKTQTLSSGDDYYSLIRSLANGEEVDADEAAEIVEASEKSDEELEADVETMAKRVEWASQLTQRRQLEKQRSSVERELEKAQTELNAAIERLRPAVTVAQAKSHEVESKILSFTLCENHLNQTCLNPSLLQREAELRSEIRELQQKIQPLAADHQKFAACATSCERELKALLTKQKKISDVDTPMRNHFAQIIHKERAKSASWQSQATQVAKYLDELNAKLGPLEAELRDVHEQKLVP